MEGTPDAEKAGPRKKAGNETKKNGREKRRVRNVEGIRILSARRRWREAKGTGWDRMISMVQYSTDPTGGSGTWSPGAVA